MDNIPNLVHAKCSVVFMFSNTIRLRFYQWSTIYLTANNMGLIVKSNYGSYRKQISIEIPFAFLDSEIIFEKTGSVSIRELYESL